jgi:spermidine synthase
MAMVVAFLTPYFSLPARYLSALSSGGVITATKFIAILFMSVSIVLFYKFRSKSCIVLLAAGAYLQASLYTLPKQIYMLGYQYAHNEVVRNNAAIEVFEEGSVEPVVVWKHPVNNALHVTINGKTCASSIPEDMQTQILLGLIPVLFSSNPQDAVVIGLGAGITAGSVTLSDEVKRVNIIELEPKIVHSARAFAQYNHNVMANTKVNLIIDDGRHFIASSRDKFGVITSDPIDPWMAGAAALYTTEHFKECRNHLTDGGVFMQWLGLYQLDKTGLKSILAAFAEAFPDGEVWITPVDALLVGSTRKITIDVEVLREKIAARPEVAAELEFAFLDNVEDLLSQYLCSCESMKEFLKGSPVNRDGNLHVQFTGVPRYPWNHSELFEMMWSLRKWDPGKFIVPAEKQADFIAKIEKHRAVMNKHAEWKIGQYRQYMLNNKRDINKLSY